MTHGVLRDIQASLERTYDVALPVDVQDYLLDGEAAAALAVSADSVLVMQREEGSLDVGVYLTPSSLERLSQRDPFSRLDGENLPDFCAVTEEVSHFTYLVWSALHHRPVTRLELELQAEVDKFVTAALCLEAQGTGNALEALAVRLFEGYHLRDGLDAESRARYETANALGARYCRSLSRRYLKERQIGPMMAELRRFYRLRQTGKLEVAGGVFSPTSA